MPSLTLYDAFDAPVGTRETDRTLRAILRRAWRAYFARLMPVWAGFLTVASVVFGMPGLLLLEQARASTLAGSFEIMSLALSQFPFGEGLIEIAGWSTPVTDWLRPTLDRFGLESFAVGVVCLLAIAAILRAAGGRQWYQPVYDDIPRRRLALTLFLSALLPIVVGGQLWLAGVMVNATADAPRVASAAVWLVNGLALMLALFAVFLTFSLRRPAYGALLCGAGLSSLGLCGLLVVFIPLIDSWSMSGELAARAGLLFFLYLGWSMVLAGSQFAVSLARYEDPIDSFLRAGRGEQLDFGLRLVRDLEAQTRIHRWAVVDDLAASVRAHPAMVTFALDRLRRSGLVEFDEEGRRPPRRWSIRDDLEALSLHDLSRAMGTHLEPFPGLHGGAAEDVIEDLAAREQVAQGQNLLSLLQEEPDAALAPGAPMLAVADVRFGLADIDVVAGAPQFRPTAELVNRAAGDNGGPLDIEPGYVFVDAVFGAGSELDATAPGAALDLTSDMRLRDDYAMITSPDPSEPRVTNPGSTSAERQPDEEDRPLILGQASPLAAVQREIDHLLDLEATSVDAVPGPGASGPGTGSSADGTLDGTVKPAMMAPHRGWRAGLAAASQDRLKRARESASPGVTVPGAVAPPPPSPTFVDPIASWRGFRLPRGRSFSTDPFADAPRADSRALSEASVPRPTTVLAPVPATVAPLHRITFGAT